MAEGKASVPTATEQAELDFEAASVKATEEAKARFQRPKCSKAIASWRLCCSPGLQFKHYYVYGTIKPCSEEWADIKTCIYSKFVPDDKAKALLEEREQAKGKPVKVEELVWEKRDKPPEGWFHPGAKLSTPRPDGR
eukprot:m.114620 g.114620  ORF g.114620 m.114620 type:complete len:137 (+) comp16305_c0_seq2:187-597(+)